MTKVPSDDVANAILRRVNSMNLDIGVKSAVGVFVLAAAPDVIKLVMPHL